LENVLKEHSEVLLGRHINKDL